MNQVKEAKELLDKADEVLIGAAAGLSTAAGLDYAGQRFQQHFSDYIEKYGMTDMYSAGFYPFQTLEEKWAYWSRHVLLNRYGESLPLYQDLYNLVKDKEYFVMTTNVDGQFEKAGFDRERLFEIQGNYGEFQCSVPCHQEVYSNEEAIKKMVKVSQNLKIPSELIPHCPRCQAPMNMHLRIDSTFVETTIWYQEQEALQKFVERYEDKKLVLLELGVGYNTPTIIKYPFERMTIYFPNVSLIRLNIEDKPKEGIITINQDIKEVLAAWKE